MRKRKEAGEDDRPSGDEAKASIHEMRQSSMDRLSGPAQSLRHS